MNGNKVPIEISADALLNNVKKYPDAYHYERAHRLNSSKTGIHRVLKRLGISQKNTLEYPKVFPTKRAIYQNKLYGFKQQGHPFLYR